MRHNEIRDVEAELLSEVCKDVTVEPPLLPITGEQFTNNSANIADDARLDVSAMSFWAPQQRAFMDVRIFHPNSSSYVNKTPASLYTMHENQKKVAYNERIINVDQGTFTPLIFSTSGGMGVECLRCHNRLATLLAAKRGEEYATTINFIRKKIRFSLLRSTLIAIRGTRVKLQNYKRTPIADVDIGLVDDRSSTDRDW